MSTNQLETSESLLKQEVETPLQIFTQHISPSMASVISKHPELTLVEDISLESAKKGANPGTDFDSINFKMVSGSMKTAGESGAEVLFYSNEQQDQLGVCAKKSVEGRLQILTAHQIALILSEIVISKYQKNQDEGGKEPLLLRSLVLTHALEVQAAYNKIKATQIYSGLTSLQEALRDQHQDYTILLAMDEANHFLFPERSPKESIDYAIQLLAEKALALKKEGRTLVDFLIELYRMYGFYHEKSFTINREDADGEKHIKGIVGGLRKEAPDALFDKPVRVVNDFHKGFSANLLNAKKTKTTLAKADVLQLLFTDNSKVTFAPTEDYSKLFYHFSVSSRIHGKEAYDEAKLMANESIIGMMEKIGKR